MQTFKTSGQEVQRRTEELFIERFRNDSYQSENAIDGVITDGVITDGVIANGVIANGVIADGESALIGIRIDQNADETLKLMRLFGLRLKI